LAATNFRESTLIVGSASSLIVFVLVTVYLSLSGCGGLLGAGFKIMADEEGEEEEEEADSEGKEVDVFRDTPVRYLGYANGK
jgi:hypothetical protein